MKDNRGSTSNINDTAHLPQQHLMCNVIRSVTAKGIPRSIGAKLKTVLNIPTKAEGSIVELVVKFRIFSWVHDIGMVSWQLPETGGAYYVITTPHRCLE